MRPVCKFSFKMIIVCVILVLIILVGIFYFIYDSDKINGHIAFSDSVTIYLSNVNKINYTGKLNLNHKLSTYPALSPDGSKLAFCGEDLVDGKSIYYLVIIEKINGDFCKYKEIINLKMDTEIGQISWSLDSNKIAFLSGANVHDYSGVCKRKLSILDLEKNNITGILDNFNFQTAPVAWSCDNRFLIFSTPDGEIIKYDIESKNTRKIAEGFGPQSSPVENIIIFSDQNNMYLSDLDGKIQKSIIKKYGGTELFSNIVWSPDGKYFLYTRHSSSVLLNLTGPTIDLILSSVGRPYIRRKLFSISRGFKGVTWSK